MTTAPAQVAADTLVVAVLELAEGATPADVARRLDLTPESVDALARHFGWPRTTTRLKAAARAITAGHEEQALAGAPAVVPLPRTEPEPQPAPEPEGQPQPAAAATAHTPESDREYVGRTIPGFNDPVEHVDAAPPSVATSAAARDAAADRALDAELVALADVASRPADETRATLRMPLPALVYPDGRRIDLGHAVVEVELHPDGVLAAIAGDDIGTGPVMAYASTAMTPEGAAAIRALHDLLGPVA